MADHVQLLLLCPTCLTGLHLPAVAATVDGTFAEYGLDVELNMAPPGRDWTLAGLAGPRIEAVAGGRAEFALTMVTYLVAVQATSPRPLPARFVAALHRRSSIAAVVAAGSDITEAADLAGRVTARHAYGWWAREYEAALERIGVGAPVVVDRPEPHYAAEPLGRGEVEVLPVIADTLPVIDRYAGVDTRVVPLDVPVYGSGLLAGDAVPVGLAARVAAAMATAFERHRADPEPGIHAFTRRFPDLDVDQVRTGWDVFEPYAFDGDAPGAMDRARWEETVRYTAGTHGLPVPPAESVYRPELVLAPEEEHSLA